MIRTHLAFSWICNKEYTQCRDGAVKLKLYSYCFSDVILLFKRVRGIVEGGGGGGGGGGFKNWRDFFAHILHVAHGMGHCSILCLSVLVFKSEVFYFEYFFSRFPVS